MRISNIVPYFVFFKLTKMKINYLLGAYIAHRRDVSTDLKFNSRCLLIHPKDWSEIVEERKTGKELKFMGLKVFTTEDVNRWEPIFID